MQFPRFFNTTIENKNFALGDLFFCVDGKGFFALRIGSIGSFSVLMGSINYISALRRAAMRPLLLRRAVNLASARMRSFLTDLDT